MPSIPLNSTPGEQTTTLGQTTVILRTAFNYSAKCWTMDIYDANRVPIVMGIMLVPFVDLLRAFPAAKEKIGTMILAADSFTSSADPESLGNSTMLVWWP